MFMAPRFSSAVFRVLKVLVNSIGRGACTPVLPNSKCALCFNSSCNKNGSRRLTLLLTFSLTSILVTYTVYLMLCDANLSVQITTKCKLLRILISFVCVEESGDK